MRAVNDHEREVFEAIRNAPNIAVVSTEFEGEETAVICAVDEDEDGNSLIFPLALMVTDDIMSRLTRPDDDL